MRGRKDGKRIVVGSVDKVLFVGLWRQRAMLGTRSAYGVVACDSKRVGDEKKRMLCTKDGTRLARTLALPAIARPSRPALARASAATTPVVQPWALALGWDVARLSPPSAAHELSSYRPGQCRAM